MKIIIKTIVLLTALSASIPALAECAGVRCNGIVITRLFVHSTGVSIRTSGDESKLDCNAGSGNYVALENTHTNFNAIYSLLLAAHTTQSPITLRTNSSPDENCKLSYVVSDK